MLSKNQELEMLIDDIGNDGEGIGHTDGIAVFVKDAAKGDSARVRIIKVKKHYAYGRLMEVLDPSPDRVKPPCPHARACGGCSLMHLSYESQLAWKQDKVTQCLKRIGGIEDVEEIMEPIVGMQEPLRYRNKAQFPVGKNKEGKCVIGFYTRHSHSIIDTEACLLQPKVFDSLLAACREFLEQSSLEPYDEETGKGLIRHFIFRWGKATGQIQVCVVVNGDVLLAPGEKPISAVGDSKSASEKLLVEKLQKISGVVSIVLNRNTQNTNRITGDTIRVLWGSERIEDHIGDVRFSIGALSFYQVNPDQTEKMYQKALEYADLKGGETVWDLYCGIGTISLFLAQKAGHVHGVEIVKQAIDDARENAKLNRMENVTFYVGKAEEVLPREYETNNIRADVIVVDPPRKGCDEKAIETMLKMQPERIVYVSCDPATLARDVRLLSEGGYRPEKVCAFDNFSQSTHVETVVRLERADT